MEESAGIQLLSTFVSIAICITIVIKYFKYKKRLNVLEGLEELKGNNELTTEDKEYIEDNYKEYEEKSQKAEAMIKLLNPVFILITGIIFAFTPFAQAMIYMNAVVVAYLLVILDKNHKKTTFELLGELKN